MPSTIGFKSDEKTNHLVMSALSSSLRAKCLGVRSNRDFASITLEHAGTANGQD